MKKEDTWTYAVCESCLKNAHKEVKMEKKEIISADENGAYSKEHWVCSNCGATRKL